MLINKQNKKTDSVKNEKDVPLHSLIAQSQSKVTLYFVERQLHDIVYSVNLDTIITQLLNTLLYCLKISSINGLFNTECFFSSS